MIQPFSRPFPPELFVNILAHVKNPRPPPLSRPPRSELRQPHLAVCMRVSRYFKSIAEKLLYTHVVTDYFQALQAETQATRSGGMFALTESLDIEFWEKGLEATYATLAKDAASAPGIWYLVGLSWEQRDQVTLSECAQEIQQVGLCLQRLCKLGMSKTFPKLKRISVASIYGVENNDYERLQVELQSSQDRDDCMEAFNKFLSTSTTLESLCVRDSAGPLAIDYFVIGPIPKYTRTIHFCAKSKYLPLPAGSTVKWVADTARTDDLAGLLSAVHSALQTLWISRMVNDQVATPAVHVPATVDIYCSTNQYSPAIYSKLNLAPLGAVPPRKSFKRRIMTEREEQAMVGKLETQVREAYFGKTGLKDTFRWHVSGDTPVCACCGSGPPQ